MYHRDCLAQWKKRTVNEHPVCPLCRSDIPRSGVVDIKFECSERQATGARQSEDAAASEETSGDISQIKLEDLQHRLFQAVTDKLDMQERLTILEKENTGLQEAFLRAQDRNTELQNENKELKLTEAAHKTRISKLADLIETQEEQLVKLDYTHRYLKSDKTYEDDSNKYLERLSPSEKLNLLINRVAELESMSKTLTELRDGWKKKCDKLGSEYLALEREYSSLLLKTYPTEPSGFIPDPLNDLKSADSKIANEDEGDVPRKISRSIDFGFMNNDTNHILRTPTRTSRPSKVGISNSLSAGKSVKAKPQSIAKFFKAQ